MAVILVSAAPSFAGVPHERSAVLVNKKTNTLYLVDYENGEYKTVLTFHATLGKVVGDKEEEGDLKTPEGIYTLTSKTTPPQLQPKFGKMAFNINFPNSYDEIAGRSGSHIMLHATDDPKRLEQSYDSLGCVVLKNEEIAQVEKHVRLGLTPILIFSDLTDEYLKPGADTQLKDFFAQWIGAWESREVGKYIDFYHTDFKAQGKDKSHWKDYKGNLIKRYSHIEVKPEDVLYYRHPKYSMITFTQNYRSTLINGQAGFRARGTKILYVAEEGGKPRIIAETYTPLMW